MGSFIEFRSLKSRATLKATLSGSNDFFRTSNIGHAQLDRFLRIMPTSITHCLICFFALSCSNYGKGKGKHFMKYLFVKFIYGITRFWQVASYNVIFDVIKKYCLLLKHWSRYRARKERTVYLVDYLVELWLTI